MTLFQAVKQPFLSQLRLMFFGFSHKVAGVFPFRPHGESVCLGNVKFSSFSGDGSLTI